MSESKDYSKLKKEFEEFSYIVSHDLRAPLRAITSITEWIEEDLDKESNPEVWENFQLLKGKTLRMDKMIEALVDYSRIDTRDNEVSTLNLKELIQDVIDEIQDTNPLVKFSVSCEVGEIKTLKNKLYKTLFEVLSNSADHNEDGVKVEVVVTKKDNELNFLIQDNGKGFDEDPEKLFRIFYTCSGSKTQIGAGLAIVKKILDKIDGDISITSDENGVKTVMKWPLTN